MAIDDTTDPTASGDTTANPDSNGSAPKPADAPVYTKADLTAKIAREVAKEREGRASLEQRLAALEEEKRTAEEAKLSASQRQELELKRERERVAAQIATLTAQAATERTKRHEVLRAGEAAALASTIAAQVANPGLLPHVRRSIAERLVVEVGADGTERVVIRMGAEGDNEPLESGFAKFRDEHLTAFLKVATGSGAQHGAGGSSAGGRAAMLAMPPEQRIEAALRARAASGR